MISSMIRGVVVSERLLKENIISNKMISVDIRSEISSTPSHTHDFLEMLYIFSGSAIHYYKEKKTPLSKGKYVFIDFNSEHSLKNKSDDFKAITCTFVPEFIDSTLLGCTGIADALKSYNINLVSRSIADIAFFDDDPERILPLLELMMDEYKRKDAGYMSIIRSCLIQILVLTTRKTELVTAHIDERISEIAEYINGNYSENVTLEEMSKRFYCSLSNISILFKKHMGMTFTEYLRKTRMEAACKLLVNTVKSIDEIANDTGYSDVRSFRKHFKNSYNVTPLRFRKMFGTRTM